MNQGLKIPVVLFVFNRPDTTKVVFERIRSVKPHTLIIVADGPRSDRPGEPEACKDVRRIVDKVDWPCELLRNFSETNIGCGLRVAGGLDWVFQQIEEAIILEDDCVPDPTFFPFCEELLERYRSQTGIMQISGSNALFGRHFVDQSYYFSKYPHCWGWATWRRAWRLFDFDMEAWKTERDECLSHFDDSSERAFWRSGWDSLAKGTLNAWAYRWCLACLNANGLSVTPSVNLVANIGFGSTATHTKSYLAAIRPAVRKMQFPLHHPTSLEPNVFADRVTARRLFYSRSAFGKLVEMITRRILAISSSWRAPKSLKSFQADLHDFRNFRN